jgi:hypothetical protein
MARKADPLTLGLPGIPARRGRPPTGKAMTSAMRQKLYRERKAAASNNRNALRKIPLALVRAELHVCAAYYARRHAWRDSLAGPFGPLSLGGYRLAVTA